MSCTFSGTVISFRAVQPVKALSLRETRFSGRQDGIILRAVGQVHSQAATLKGILRDELHLFRYGALLQGRIGSN